MKTYDIVCALQKHAGEILLMGLAITLTLLPFVFDGRTICTPTQCGLSIGTNYRDGVWFLAVAETAFKTMPFQMPIYAGAPLQGYHYLPNLFAYALSKIGIPPLVSYYQLIPLIYTSLIIVIILRFNAILFRSRLFSALLVIVLLLGMHLAPFTSLYHTGRMNNSALINTFQATRLLESPHSALALLMLLWVISYLYEGVYFHKKQTAISWIMLFLSLGTKVYFACTLFGILLVYEVVHLCAFFSVKNVVRIGLMCLVAVVGYLTFYSPSVTSSSPLFVFSPFATVHHMIESDGLFYQPKMVLARYYLYAHGMSPRLIAIELYSALLYVLYYFGVRVCGLGYLVVQLLRRKLTSIELSIGIMISVDIAASILFIQRGDWYNPIQFAVPAAYLCAVLTAIALYRLAQTYKKIGAAAIMIVALITIPGNMLNLSYLNNPARFIITSEEMKALEDLKSRPEGSVFYPIDENDMAYVPAFTGKVSYVNFVNVLQNAGIDYTDRLNKTKSPERFDPTRIEVSYFYLPKRFPQSQEYIKRLESSHATKKIYENRAAVIFQKIKLKTNS